MAGYLESYAAIEERKARNRQRLKTGTIAAVSIVIVAVVAYALFRNHHQEQVVKTFLRKLQNHQYQDAYRMWGCTEQTPCRDYAFAKFMEDWGPNSPQATESNVRIAVSQSCGNTVFIRLNNPKGEPTGLLVDRSTDTISFAPSNWVECPGRHWHFWEFIKGLFR